MVFFWLVPRVLKSLVTAPLRIWGLFTTLAFIEIDRQFFVEWALLQMAQVQEANQMVEEMMLLANVSVAEAIAHHFPSCSLLRRHPVCVCTFLCVMSVCMRAGARACAHVCGSACGPMRTCVRACMCVCVCACVWGIARVRVCVCTCLWERKLACVCPKNVRQSSRTLCLLLQA